MEFKKLAPWNWFKDEESSNPQNMPVNRVDREINTPLAQLHNEIDRMFDNVFGGATFPWSSNDAAWPRSAIKNQLLRPKVDIASTGGEYTITVEVPGVKEDDIRLELADSTLTIQGEKKQASKSKDKDFYRVERSYGSFQRILSLPADADRDAIDARFEDGVLTLKVPKKSVKNPEAKMIQIKKAS